MGLETLVKKIKEQFTANSIIELYVLDETGVPFELYSGLPEGLTVVFMEQILCKPSTFYVFSIIGIDREYADIVDIHRDKMIRKEFCWLTDPEKPAVEARGGTALQLSWAPVQFCGVDVSVVADSVHYVLEACQGQAWHRGLASKYVPDVSGAEFKMLARGPRLLNCIIDDLTPATWYHFRLCIEYMGNRVVSDIRPVATLVSVPSQPSPPRITIVSTENSMFTQRTRVSQKLRVTWAKPAENGSAIDRYQLQLRETILNDNSSSPGRPHSADDASTNSARTAVTQRYHTAYCNLLNAVTLEAPASNVCGWELRVRAKNNTGWSDFSDSVYIDDNIYPTFFASSKNVIISSPFEDTTSSLFLPSSTINDLKPIRVKTSPKPKSSPTKVKSKPRPATATSEDPGRVTHMANIDIWQATSNDEVFRDASIESSVTFDLGEYHTPVPPKPQPKKSPTKTKTAAGYALDRAKLRDMERATLFGEDIKRVSDTGVSEFAPKLDVGQTFYKEADIDRVWWGMAISKDFIKAVVGNRYDNPDIPPGLRARPLTTR